MDTIFSLHGATFAYPGREPVLRGASFALHARDRVGLIGPNGCGKSTLVHAVMGLSKIQAGELRHGDTVLGPDSRDADWAGLRRDVGFLFQDSDDQLFCPTVLEDVAFGPLNLGQPPEQARQTALDTLAELGLAGYEERVTHELSGGEKKLVALAAVMAMRPSALILDEPTNNLDADTRERLIHVLRGLDAAVLVISHDWDFLHHTVDTYFCMRQGRVDACDEPSAHTHTHIHPGGEAPHHHHD